MGLSHRLLEWLGKRIEIPTSLCEPLRFNHSNTLLSVYPSKIGGKMGNGCDLVRIRGKGTRVPTLECVPYTIVVCLSPHHWKSTRLSSQDASLPGTEGYTDMAIEQEVQQEEIITAARDLFSRKGFHGTSIPDIAHAAGISTGLIYYIFASKEDILLACCEEVATSHLDLFQQASHLADPLERFDCIVRELYTSLDEGSKQVIIMYRDSSTLPHETRQRILFLIKNLDNRFLELFREGQQAGLNTILATVGASGTSLWRSSPPSCSTMSRMSFPLSRR